VVGLSRFLHSGQHMRLRSVRDPLEGSLVAHDRERPWLLIDSVLRFYGRINQMTDRFLIDGLERVFAYRTPARDRLLYVHSILLYKVGCARTAHE
jgi:hypothetical protein